MEAARRSSSTVTGAHRGNLLAIRLVLGVAASIAIGILGAGAFFLSQSGTPVPCTTDACPDGGIGAREVFLAGGLILFGIALAGLALTIYLTARGLRHPEADRVPLTPLLAGRLVAIVQTGIWGLLLIFGGLSLLFVPLGFAAVVAAARARILSVLILVALAGFLFVAWLPLLADDAAATRARDLLIVGVLTVPAAVASLLILRGERRPSAPEAASEPAPEPASEPAPETLAAAG